MKNFQFLSTLTITTIAMIAGNTAFAQTERAVERRADRAERRAENRVERANYFSNESWQQINPWTQQYNLEADRNFDRAERALDNAVGAAQRAANLENRSDQIDANRSQADVDIDQTLTGNRNTDWGNSWYGYRDSDQDARWFYDYYTVVPTYSYSTVRIAEIDDVDLLTDADAADRVTVSSEVDGIKKAMVGSHEHLVVKLSANDEDIDAVDLGPVSELDPSDVNVGDKITATGWVEEIGDKTVLIARRASVGDHQATIQRSLRQTFDGNVVDVKEVVVEDHPHYIAVVESDNKRTLVDLGPVTSYTVKVQPQSKIYVTGMPVRTNEQVLVMAKEVKLDGQVIEIQ